MTNIATVSDEELQHTREIYADLVAEGRVLDPANELDRMHARGIIPAMLELIDEVLRQRKWAREMVEMTASGGRLDGYRELADRTSAADARVDDLLADLRWLGSYLAEHYPIGRPDIGGRICIGNACGATWEEAVRAGRELHERAAAAYAERMADQAGVIER